MNITNKELNEALEKLGKLKGTEKSEFVSLDDTIKFNCIRCGHCCSGRSDIILNPFDVYQIAKSLDMTIDDVIKKYCSIHAGSNSGLPIVTLQEDERGLCPFLKFFTSEGKFGCSINKNKPGACIMHPIGVVRTFNKENNDTETHFIKVPPCNNHKKDVEIKIRDFIKPYLDNEKCHEIGSLLIHEPLKYINTIEFLECVVYKNKERLKKYPEDIVNKIISLPKDLIDMLYRTYMSTTTFALYDLDINKDFLSQVDTIKKNVKENCIKMICVLSILDLDFTANDFTEDIEEEKNKIIGELKKGFDEFCKRIEMEKSDK